MVIALFFSIARQEAALAQTATPTRTPTPPDSLFRLGVSDTVVTFEATVTAPDGGGEEFLIISEEAAAILASKQAQNLQDVIASGPLPIPVGAEQATALQGYWYHEETEQALLVSDTALIADENDNYLVDLSEFGESAPGGKYIFTTCASEEDCAPQQVLADLDRIQENALYFEQEPRVSTARSTSLDDQPSTLQVAMDLSAEASPDEISVEWRLEGETVPASQNLLFNVATPYSIVTPGTPTTQQTQGVLFAPRAGINQMLPLLNLPEARLAPGTYQADIYYQGNWETSVTIEVTE
jgi:hypothetical protein